MAFVTDNVTSFIYGIFVRVSNVGVSQAEFSAYGLPTPFNIRASSTGTGQKNSKSFFESVEKSIFIFHFRNHLDCWMYKWSHAKCVSHWYIFLRWSHIDISSHLCQSISIGNLNKSRFYHSFIFKRMSKTTSLFQVYLSFMHPNELIKKRFDLTSALICIGSLLSN